MGVPAPFGGEFAPCLWGQRLPLPEGASLVRGRLYGGVFFVGVECWLMSQWKVVFPRGLGGGGVTSGLGDPPLPPRVPLIVSRQNVTSAKMNCAVLARNYWRERR